MHVDTISKVIYDSHSINLNNSNNSEVRNDVKVKGRVKMDENQMKVIEKTRLCMKIKEDYRYGIQNKECNVTRIHRDQRTRMEWSQVGCPRGSFFAIISGTLREVV